MEDVVLTIAQEYDVFHAQKRAADFARGMGFSRTDVYRLATVVSELCNNLVLHAAGGGRLKMTSLRRGGGCGIELIVDDDGPGIDDLALAMTDGFSTMRGLGSGLPGSRRLMDEFHIESSRGMGTKVVARLWQ